MRIRTSNCSRFRFFFEFERQQIEFARIKVFENKIRLDNHIAELFDIWRSSIEIELNRTKWN